MQEDDRRFSGIQRLYGRAGLALFSQARVCVVGIGGVGSWAAEALARSGVGQLTLIDLDDVCITNINRQAHATEDTVGRSKVLVMADRLKAIHPGVALELIDDFIASDNVAELIGLARPDIVLDCIDGVGAKAALVAHCHALSVPVLVSGGAGGRTDPTQVKMDDLARTTHDPLAAALRARLRRHHGFPRDPKRRFGVDCVYSSEPQRYPDGDGGICSQRPPSDQEAPVRLDCASGYGASMCVTATFGLALASRTLSRLLQSSPATSA